MMHDLIRVTDIAPVPMVLVSFCPARRKIPVCN